jgi:dTDP-4-dehydrorhamnose reductase
MGTIALLGASGQLGQDLRSALQLHDDVVALTRSDCDVTDHAAVAATLKQTRPGTIINTTAYHRVDDCEDNPAEAFRVNALAVLNLSRVANDLNAVLVHFSTDYVFDGRSSQPYTERSEPMPLSVYGNSKLAGEYLLRSTSKNHVLIRTCGLYGVMGSRGKGGNFVEAMLQKARAGQRIEVVNDQRVTPTYTRDLADQVAVLLSTSHRGLFHITNEGACSWFEFASAIFELTRIQANLAPTTSEIYKAPAIRPRFSVLENARLKDLGLNRMRHWRDALAAYLESRGLIGAEGSIAGQSDRADGSGA